MTDIPTDRVALSPDALKLLASLMQDAGVDGTYQVSIAALCTSSGLSKAAFTKARAELVTAGLVSYEAPRSDKGLRGPTIYTLHRSAVGEGLPGRSVSTAEAPVPPLCEPVESDRTGTEDLPPEREVQVPQHSEEPKPVLSGWQRVLAWFGLRPKSST
jgi:hypothetical protein